MEIKLDENEVASDDGYVSHAIDKTSDPTVFSRRDAIRGAMGLFFLYLSGCNERDSTTEFEFSLRRNNRLTPQQEAEEYLKVFEMLEEEINDRRYDFPQNERETALLANHSRRQSNQKIRVPASLGKKKDGSLVISRFSEPISYKNFLRWKLKMNIGYLRKKIDCFKKIVAYYEGEILKIKEQLRENTRNTMNEEDRRTLQKRIDIMLENWEVEFRNRRDNDQAKAARERIAKLQRQLGEAHQAQPAQINTTVDHVDLLEVARLIDENLLKGDEIDIRSETKLFEGDGTKLIAVYQDEIEHVNREYIRPLEQRMAANEHWLNRTKEKN